MKNKHIPEIRFIGFGGDWEQKPLKELVERITRKNKKLESTLPLTISAQYGLIDQETFFNKTVASANLEGYYLLYKGEFAYNKSYSNGYPFGAVKRLEKYDKGVLSSLYICFKALNSVSSDFLAHYFESTAWHNEISIISVEGARNHGLLNISVSDFFDTLHIIPTLAEQKKIGNFLQQLDEYIALHQQELNTLKRTKQGFLQKMFPKEGESVPEVRFPGFTGDWEQRKLGDCVNYIKGFAFKSEDYRSEGIRIVRVSDLSSNDIKTNNDKIFLDRKYEKEYEKYKLNIGDIIITTVGSRAELKESAVGRPIIINKEDEGLLNQNLVKIHPIDGYDSYFIYENLLKENYTNYIASIERGNANQSNIAIIDLWLYTIYIPSNEEQQQIGSFLKILNDTIALHQRELDALIETKKAFLQKMFV